jgi:hypothetical protein
MPASSGSFNRTNEKFSIMGWEDDDGRFYTIRAHIPVTANMNLYAVWGPWGNIEIAYLVGGPIVNGQNLLQQEWVFNNANFRASVDQAFVVGKYPYMEAGHWPNRNVESARTLRHAADEIMFMPDIDPASIDLPDPVSRTFAIDLRSNNFSHLGTSTRTIGEWDNCAPELLAAGECGDLLEGGEYGDPFMRIFWPGAKTPLAHAIDNPANWWGRMRNATGTTGGVEVLQNAGADGLGAAYFLSGKLEVGETTFTYEVIGRPIGGRNRGGIQHGRPANWSAYILEDGETLNFTRSAHVQEFLPFLNTHAVYNDFAALAARSVERGATTESNHIVFSRAVLNGFVPTSNNLPDRTLNNNEINFGEYTEDDIFWLLIQDRILGTNAAPTWNFDATTITRR